ncbi:hypothetical protein JQX24_17995 [Marivita cryptomonadis]|nr:hypothetical protein [Marivita cryptomonadis]MBM2351766.1 hypothetical protein [Marivita cryptomonadis]MBM2418880.1 hypothetical protein [Marivita cryptomonadis]MBM2460671.1 hypothetical protein [Marivita cryptomonadis]MBM2484195.1 hypothetical protein [Marivita cryptomonadis]
MLMINALFFGCAPCGRRLRGSDALMLWRATRPVFAESPPDMLDGLVAGWATLPDIPGAILFVQQGEEVINAGASGTLRKEIEVALRRLNLGSVYVEETDRTALELLALWLITRHLISARCHATEGNDAVPAVSGAGKKAEDHRQSSSGNSVCRRNATIMASSATVRTVERGSFGPVFKSSTVARLRHFATVLGLMPSSLLNCAS